MFRLLGYIFAGSLGRTSDLLQDPGLHTDQELQARIIAETGVWDAAYEAARLMPPVESPELAPFQSDFVEVMRLFTVAGSDLRTYFVIEDEASLNRAEVSINRAIEALEMIMASAGGELR